MGRMKEQMMDDQEHQRDSEVAEYLGLTPAEFGSTDFDYDERSGESVVRFTRISDEIKAKLQDYNHEDNTVPIDWNEIGSYGDADQ